jgi:hypothetical protein
MAPAVLVTTPKLAWAAVLGKPGPRGFRKDVQVRHPPVRVIARIERLQPKLERVVLSNRKHLVDLRIEAAAKNSLIIICLPGFGRMLTTHRMTI